MSRAYKFHNPDGLYFVSFATVNWVDVFTRAVYCEIVVDSLKYCQSNLGMQLYCWCLMPNHAHLIFRATDGRPAKLLGRFKEFTAKRIVKEIERNVRESRRNWLLRTFEAAGEKSSNVQRYQFWQHDNHPIELISNYFIEQKSHYIHQNPVEAGYVTEAHHWKYSSATDYSGGKGLVPVDFL